MTEEEFNMLMEVVEAKIDAKIAFEANRDGLNEAMRFSAIKQEFIDVFIFGGEPLIDPQYPRGKF